MTRLQARLPDVGGVRELICGSGCAVTATSAKAGLLLLSALLLGSCDRNTQNADQSAPQAQPTLFVGCGNRISAAGDRTVTDFRAQTSREGEANRIFYYAVDPALPPAIGDRGTSHVATLVGERALGLVRANARDSHNPTRYPGMTYSETLMWNLVPFGRKVVRYDAARDFGVSDNDDLPTRQLFFIEGPWIVRTLVPDEQVRLAEEFGEQARAGLRALLATQKGCSPAGGKDAERAP